MMPKEFIRTLRLLPIVVLLLTATGCKIDIDMVHCEGLIGTPWSNEKLGSLEGDWLEIGEPKENGSQRVIYRLHIDSDRNGLKYQEIDDPKMPRPLNKTAPLIRLSSLDSVDLVFLTAPDDSQHTILLGILERPDEDNLSLRLAVAKSFREQIKNGGLDGEILPPYLDDTEPDESEILKTTLRATEEQLLKLIQDDSDKSLFEPPMEYLKRIKK